jgi:hypothetical protein
MQAERDAEFPDLGPPPEAVAALSAIEAQLPVLTASLAKRRVALAEMLDPSKVNPVARVLGGGLDVRERQQAEFELAKIDRFIQGMDDPTFGQTLTDAATAWQQFDPETKGGFMQNVRASFTRNRLAVEQIIESLGLFAPQKLEDSAHFKLAALGFIPPAQDESGVVDPTELIGAVATREYMMRERPALWRRTQAGLAAEGRSGFLTNFAAEAIAAVPVLAAEVALTKGAIGVATGGRALATEVGINMSLGFAEGYLVTPGDQKTRLFVGGVGATLGGVLTPAIPGIKAGMSRLRKLKTGEEVIDKANARIQLAKMLRIVPETLSDDITEDAHKVVSAIDDGLVDSQSMIDMFGRLSAKGEGYNNLGVAMLGEYVESVRLAVVEEQASPFALMRARAKARAKAAGDSLAETWADTVPDSAALGRIVERSTKLGLSSEVVESLGRGEVDNVAVFVERESAFIRQDLESRLTEASKEFPLLSPEDLNHVGTRLHDFLLEGRIRGVDVDVDINFLKEIVEEVDENLVAAHPGTAGAKTAKLAGRVKTTLATKGELLGEEAAQEFHWKKDGSAYKTRGAAKKAANALAAKNKAKKYTVFNHFGDEWVVVELAEGAETATRATFRMAIDLFADKRPGMLAATNIHEMSHGWIEALKFLNPDRYEKLLAEVKDVYISNADVAMDLGELDERRLSELFADLMTNSTLNQEVVSGRPFIREMIDRFGKAMAELLGKVDSWRKRFYDSKKTGLPEAWSQELRQTATRFARGDWRALMDDLVARDTPRASKGRPFRSTVAYEVLDMNDFTEAVRTRISIGNQLDLLRRAAKIRPNDPELPIQIKKAEESFVAAKEAEATARRQAGRLKGYAANRQGKDLYVNNMPMRGLPESGYRVRVRTDTRSSFLNSMRAIKWGNLAKAFLSGEMVDGVSIRDRVRRLGEWYDRSRAGAAELLDAVREQAKLLPGYRAAYWDSITPDKVMSYLGAFGASKRPRENLALAVKALVYNGHRPHGHYAKAMFRDDAMRSAIVHEYGSLADAPAREVLTMMADWESATAQRVMLNVTDVGYPRAGQTWADWLRETVSAEMDGSLKLVSFEQNIKGIIDSVTNDVWQWRFFLHNNPARLRGIYALGRGRSETYRRLVGEDADFVGGHSRAAAKGTREIEKLIKSQESLDPVKDSEVLAGIEERIAELRGEVAKLSEEGARIVSEKTGKFVGYEPTKGEYFLMEDLQMQFAKYLNRLEGEEFWTGSKVQAAIWGLMRGKTADGIALFDDAAVMDFGSEAQRAIATRTEGGSILRDLMEQANEDGIEDRANDVFARTAQDFHSNHAGEGHAHNRYLRAMSYRLGLKRMTDLERWKHIGNQITMSGKFTKDVVVALGAKGLRRFVSGGMYRGVADRNVSLRFQSTAGQAERIGAIHAALNFQDGFEWAAVRETVDIRQNGFDGNVDGLTLRFRGITDPTAVETKFNEFIDAVGRRMDAAEPRSVIPGATVEIENGAGFARISFFPRPGVEWGRVTTNMSALLKDFDVELQGWRGEKGYVDAFETFNEGDWRGVSIGWRKRWEQLSGDPPGLGRRGNPRSAATRSARRADLVAARHLWHALQGLDGEGRRKILRAYALATRARLTEVNALYRNPVAGAAKEGAALTKKDVLAHSAVARGNIARLLADIEEEAAREALGRNAPYAMAVTRQEVKDAFADVAKWAKKSSLPPDIRPYLTGVKARTGKLGITKPGVLESSERFMVLDPEDGAAAVSARMRDAAADAAALGAEDEAVARALTSEYAERGTYWASLLPEDGTAAEASLAGQMGTTSKSMVRAAVSSFRHFWRWLGKNRFEDVKVIDRDVSEAFNAGLSSDVMARQMARRMSELVLRDLSEADVVTFERFLQGEKAMVALNRLGGDTDKLGAGMREFLMTPAERDRILRNPDIAEAVRLHKSIVQPEFEKVLGSIDPDNLDNLLETESGAFMPSMRYNPEIHGSKVRRVQPSTVSQAGKFNVPKNTQSMRTFTGTGDAYVTDYEELLRWKLNRDIQIDNQRRIVKTLIEKGLAVPHGVGKAIPHRGIPAGSTRQPSPIVRGKEKIGWRRIRVSERPTWVEIADEAAGKVRKRRQRTEEYWVPRPVARAWEQDVIGGITDIKSKNVWHRFADFTTAAMLATFAEATRHSIRVLAMLSRVPRAVASAGDLTFEPQTGNIAEVLIPYFGVRLNRLAKMANVYNTPDGLLMERWLTRINALPGRAFEEIDSIRSGDTGGGKIRATLRQSKENLLDVAHTGRGFLFDLPTKEKESWLKMHQGHPRGEAFLSRTVGGPFKGMRFADRKNRLLGLMPIPENIWGFDVRARLVATQMFLEHQRVSGRIAPNVKLADLAKSPNDLDTDLREFITQFGQFNTNIQTRMVNWARKHRLNPFAGSQGGFRPAEIETTFGISRIPMEGVPPTLRAWYAAQTIYGGWLGYVMVLGLANKALSGHWPWENQEGHELDLDLGRPDLDGAPTYISGNFLAPAATRAARSLGVKALLDERFGQTTGKRAAGFIGSGKAAQEVSNFLLGGPPAQAVFTAATGHVPFLVGPGRLLRVAPPQPTTGAQLRQNLISAVVNMNANIAQLSADQLATTRHAQDPLLRHSFEVGHVIFGKIGSTGQAPVVASGTLARAENRRLQEVAWHAIQRYQAEPNQHHRNEIYKDYLSSFPERRRVDARRQFWNMMRGLKRSQFKRAVQSRLLRETE